MQKHTRISPLVVIFRILFTLGLAAVVAFIFTRSFKDGALSSEESARLLAFLRKTLQHLTDRENTEHFVRKLAHFTEFTVLGGMAQFCLRVYTRHYIRHISFPLLFGLMTALADETIQLRMPGRSSSVIDVWLDFSGVCFGVGCALVVLLIFHVLGWFILHDDGEVDRYDN